LHEAPIVAHTLKGEGFDASEVGTGRGTPLVPVAVRDVAATIGQRMRGQDDSCADNLQVVAVPLQEVGKRTGVSTDDPRAGIGIGQDGDPMFTLQAGAQHGIAVQASQSGVRLNDTAGTLDANYGPRRHNGVMVPVDGGDKPHVLAAVAHCVDMGGNKGLNGGGILEELTQPLGTNEAHAVSTNMAVRRLTPIECERLQGFPDFYTMIPWKKKPADQCPDGPRYKALGNSMAVPVMRWIGKRIAEALR
jgi:DNA (cytosine-5)-methyltransferase 1